MKKRKKYTKAQIQEFLEYMNYCCKEGYLDETVATEIVRNRAWGLVEEMMERGDAYANDNERETNS